jgi:hypothetical protein
MQIRPRSDGIVGDYISDRLGKEFPPAPAFQAPAALRRAFIGHAPRPALRPPRPSSASKGGRRHMRETKQFASLSSGLLARKATAMPAMRPQGLGRFGANLAGSGLERQRGRADEPEPVPHHVRRPSTALTPGHTAADAGTRRWVCTRRIADSFLPADAGWGRFRAAAAKSRRRRPRPPSPCALSASGILSLRLACA